MSEGPISPEPLVEETAPAIRKDVLKVLLLCAALIGGLAVVHLTGLKDALTSVSEVSSRIRAFGPLGGLVFAVVAACLVAVGFPRLPLCPIAAMAFGFLPGLLWGQIGTLLGCYLSFLFARWAGRDFVMRHVHRMGKLAVVLNPRSALAVAMIRQLPIPTGVVNLTLGLSSVSHHGFLIGTAIGILPEAVAFTLIGSGVAKQSLAEATGYTTVAGIILLAVWIVAAIWIGKLRQTRPAGQAE